MSVNRLGKGLDALFLDSATDVGNSDQIAIMDISPDRDQPRTVFETEALQELSDSIRDHGVLQPILVRPIADGGYRIVAGERRWRAAQLAGLTTIPAIVKTLSDTDAMVIALIENLQREDLNPVEEALGYKRLMETCNLTQEQAAVHVGKSRPTVANALRLLALPKEVLDMVSDGKLTTGHAKAILSAPEQEMVALANEIVTRSLSVREAEKLCSSMKNEKKSPVVPQEFVQDPTAKEVELSLGQELGVEVRVKYNDGRGTLSLDFYSKEQLFEYANKLGKTLEG